jgi:hypothetical protein
MQTRDLWLRKRKMRLIGCIMLFAPLAIFAGCGTRVALNEKLEKLSAAHEDEGSTPRFGAAICKVNHPTPPHNIRRAGAAVASQPCRRRRRLLLRRRFHPQQLRRSLVQPQAVATQILQSVIRFMLCLSDSLRSLTTESSSASHRVVVFLHDNPPHPPPSCPNTN